jgi:glycogen debranching enzyme
VTTNAGHLLFAGAAREEKARQTARRLLQQDMFSGWGIRTLSRSSPRYNPQGYHLGTIWPHDNSIVAMGFKRYGLTEELNAVASALFEAAKAFKYYRLPELFGGSPMTPQQTPVPYPVACRPQAWAAGAMPLIAQAFLGLCPDAQERRLYVVDPQLPPFLKRARIGGMRVADAAVDLLFERQGGRTEARVDDLRGGLSVEFVDEWPEHLR